MEIAGDGGDGVLRIKLTHDERNMPYCDAVDAMRKFLVYKFGPEKAAKFQRIDTYDPGFAHFRRVQ